MTATVRIPLVTATIGAASYGSMVLALAFVPWIMVVGNGVRQSMRSQLSEVLLADIRLRSAVADAHVRAARRVFAGWLALLFPLGAVLALVWPHLLSDHGSREQALAAVVLVLLVPALSPAGYVRMGALEAHGRAGLVNLLGAASGLVGLSLAALLAITNGPFLAFLAAGVLAMVAPFWCTLLPVFRLVDGGGEGPRTDLPDVMPRVKQFSAGSMAALVSSGIDPFIIGAIVGSIGVASYSIAGRLAIVVTVVPTAVSSLLWQQAGTARGRELPSAGMRRVRARCLAMAMVAAGAGMVLVLVGPRLGRLLGGQELPVPTGLYVAFALAGLGTSVQVPLAAALSGRHGAPVMARSSLLLATVSALGSVPATLLMGQSGPPWTSAVAGIVLAAIWYARLSRNPDLFFSVRDEVERQTRADSTWPGPEPAS